jgi:RimJ/RimL family protein N-acetyltransferase
VKAAQLDGPRLTLEPLRVDHAQEMAPVLDDPTMYEFTGGKPATVDELRRRYERQTVGHSPDGAETWLNWVVRRRDNAAAVGFVQSTVTGPADRPEAEVAWVIGTAHQHQGFAREAAQLIVGWLREQGAAIIVAYVHPDHQASSAIAGSIGLTKTDEILGGEVRWTG